MNSFQQSFSEFLTNLGLRKTDSGYEKNIPDSIKPLSEQQMPAVNEMELLYSAGDLINTGPRNIEVTSTPDDYDPRTVKEILSAPTWYPKWQLYSSMEVYWPKVLKSMDFLKNSVVNRRIILKPSDEDNVEANRKYDLVKSAQEHMKGDPIHNINGWSEFIKDIVSAYGFGLSLQLYKWDKVDDLLIPSGMLPVSGILYEYSIPEQKIYLKNGATTEDIDPNKYLLAVYKNRHTPNMSTYGQYQSLAMLYTFQNYAKSYLLKLSERFGQPLVKGTYPVNSDTNFKTGFANLLSKISDSGWIAGPQGTEVEFIASTINASNNPQQALLDYCDRMVDLVLLGQNLAQEVDVKTGGSRAAAEVHERVSINVVENLTNFVIQYLNNSFVSTILRVNDETMDNAPHYELEEIRNIQLLLLKLDAVNRVRNSLQNYVIDEEQLAEELLAYGVMVKKGQNPYFQKNQQNQQQLKNKQPKDGKLPKPQQPEKI